MKNLIAIAIIAAIAWHFLGGPGEVTLGPGVMADASPYQSNASGDIQQSDYDYTITRLADFEMKGKVLARKNYSTGREANTINTLAPIR